MTDRDDFRLGGSRPAMPFPQAAKMHTNTITVGMRSDGQVSILSAPDIPGNVSAQNMIMPRDTARWLAQQILRTIDVDAAPSLLPGEEQTK